MVVFDGTLDLPKVAADVAADLSPKAKGWVSSADIRHLGTLPVLVAHGDRKRRLGVATYNGDDRLEPYRRWEGLTELEPPGCKGRCLVVVRGFYVMPKLKGSYSAENLPLPKYFSGMSVPYLTVAALLFTKVNGFEVVPISRSAGKNVLYYGDREPLIVPKRDHGDWLDGRWSRAVRTLSAGGVELFASDIRLHPPRRT